MARNLKDNDKKKMDAPLIPVKSYPGRLVGITFLGVQKQFPFKGETKPPHEMVRYTYELSHEFMHDEEGNLLKTSLVGSLKTCWYMARPLIGLLLQSVIRLLILLILLMVIPASFLGVLAMFLSCIMPVKENMQEPPL